MSKTLRVCNFVGVFAASNIHQSFHLPKKKWKNLGLSPKSVGVFSTKKWLPKNTKNRTLGQNPKSYQFLGGLKDWWIFDAANTQQNCKPSKFCSFSCNSAALGSVQKIINARMCKSLFSSLEVNILAGRGNYIFCILYFVFETDLLQLFSCGELNILAGRQ